MTDVSSVSNIDRPPLDVDAGTTVRRRPVQREELVVSKESAATGPKPWAGVRLDRPGEYDGVAPGGEKKVLAVVNNLVEVFGKLVPRASEMKGFMSTEDFIAALAPKLASLKELQSKLQLEDINRLTLENKEKMKENDDKLQKSLEAGTKAQKSGLAARIFGWIGAAFAVVVGAIMVATGVGAVAGALMIAGGVVGLVSCALQECAKAGLISKEVMAVLGPVMTAMEVIVAVASAVVTFGGGAAGMLAKFASKVAPKIAQMAEKVGNALKSLAQLGSRAASSSSGIAQTLKNALPVADLAVNGGNTVTQTVNGALTADSTFKRANLEQSRMELQAQQELLERMGEVLQQVLEAFQAIFATLSKLMAARGQSQHNLARLPQTA
ncbi:type III secretion system translocon subunit SctE [Pseudomonas entomophila]|uniref:type III secretion system translocon subunit SctE n=1 Tax=Pseudomonas entomophila TaxID=312306 RepID=UPI002406D70E|nr:type III secretion system translocon subunit SctE [Pseudomonas entomophila]MDF9618789.1 type III secretion system translocon subunit SctE [Pseudomonas entomophila]